MHEHDDAERDHRIGVNRRPGSMIGALRPQHHTARGCEDGGDCQWDGDEPWQQPRRTGGAVSATPEVVADRPPCGAGELDHKDRNEREPEREMHRSQWGERQAAQVEEDQREQDDQPRMRGENQVSHDLRAARGIRAVFENVERVTEPAPRSYRRVVVRRARGCPHHQTVPRVVCRTPRQRAVITRRS